MTEEQVKKAILKILSRHLELNQYQIFVFGSRAAGTYHRFSDYDIGLLGKKPVSFHQMALIKADLDDSNLPFLVDMVDFSKVNKDFKKIALKQIQTWKPN